MALQYNADLSLLNLLKLTGYYRYHQVYHSKILYADFIAFMYFVWL